MNKRSFIALTIVAFSIAACKPTPHETVQDGDSTDSVENIPNLPDSTLWGRLGEDTGMSALQFITDSGDTLEVYRTSPYTGEDGRMIGDIRNYKDRFAITLTEGNETLLSAVNVSQLAQNWQSENGSMNIHSNGSVETKNLPYNGWKLWNGHFLLSAQQKQENGLLITRIDTMEIEQLDEETLVLRTPLNQELSFTRIPNP